MRIRTVWSPLLLFAVWIVQYLYLLAEISRPLVSVAEQAGLSLNWSQTPKTGFVMTWLIYEPPHDKTIKMTCARSEDSDQPGHPRSLIRVFAVGSKASQGPKLSLRGQQKLWPDWADAQNDLSLRWAFCWFCHAQAHNYVWNSDTSAPLPPRPLVTSAPSHLGPTTTSAPVWKKSLVRSAPSHLGP